MSLHFELFGGVEACAKYLMVGSHNTYLTKTTVYMFLLQCVLL